MQQLVQDLQAYACSLDLSLKISVNASDQTKVFEVREIAEGQLHALLLENHSKTFEKYTRAWKENYLQISDLVRDESQEISLKKYDDEVRSMTDNMLSVANQQGYFSLMQTILSKMSSVMNEDRENLLYAEFQDRIERLIDRRLDVVNQQTGNKISELTNKLNSLSDQLQDVRSGLQESILEKMNHVENGLNMFQGSLKKEREKEKVEIEIKLNNISKDCSKKIGSVEKDLAAMSLSVFEKQENFENALKDSIDSLEAKVMLCLYMPFQSNDMSDQQVPIKGRK